MTDTIKDIIINGGGTYNQDGTIADHKEGYYVGGIDEVKLPITFLYPEKTVQHYIEKYLDFTLSYPAKQTDSYDLAGFWIDGDYLYIERVKHTVNKNYAINLGIENNQIAIWDIVNSDCIYLSEV